MNKASKTYSIGVDIGGTNMRAVLFDGQKILADFNLATAKDNLEHLLIMLNALVEPLLERAKKDKLVVSGLGLGVAGTLDALMEKVIDPPNIPILQNVRLAELASQRLGLKVMMDNDTRCFVRAEARCGSGRKYDNIFGMTIGTGIGGAWWLNNQVYAGAHGGASEPGWLVMDYQAGVRLEEAYHKLAQNNPAVLADEAYRGDVLAEKSYQEFGRYLGITLANIINLIDPQLIVIGGGVSQSSDLFLSDAKKIMRHYVISAEAKKIKILRSKLGQLAGAVGAALLINNNQ